MENGLTTRIQAQAMQQVALSGHGFWAHGIILMTSLPFFPNWAMGQRVSILDWR